MKEAMKIKTRIILTVVTVFVYLTLAEFWQIVESPIRGASNAAQLNDTLPSYAWSRFVAANGVESTLKWATIGIVCLVWISLLTKTKTTKHEK